MKVIIVMDGGIVQEVISSEPVEVAVIDYDIDSSEPEYLSPVPQGDGKTEQAYTYQTQPSVMPERAEELYAAAK